MNIEGKQVIVSLSGSRGSVDELCTISAVSGGRVIGVRHTDGQIVSLDPDGPLRLVERDPAIRQSLRDSEIVEATLRNAWPHDVPQPDLTYNVVDVAKKYIAAVAELRAKLEEAAKTCGQLRTDLAAEIQKGLELRDERNQVIGKVCGAFPGWFSSTPSLGDAVGVLLSALSDSGQAEQTESDVRHAVGARAGEGTLDAVRARMQDLLSQGEQARAELAAARESWVADVGAANTEHDREQAEQARLASALADRQFVDVVFDGPPGPEAGRFVEVEDGEGKSINVGQWIDRRNGMWALRIWSSAAAAPMFATMCAATMDQVREALGASIQPDGTDDVVQKARDAGRALVKLGPIEQWAREAAGFVVGDGLHPQMLDAQERAKAVRYLESGLRPVKMLNTEAAPPIIGAPAPDVAGRLDAIGQAISKLGDMMSAYMARAEEVMADRTPTTPQESAPPAAGPGSAALAESVRGVIALSRMEERGVSQTEGGEVRAMLDRRWPELSQDEQAVVESLSAELRRLVIRTAGEHRTAVTPGPLQDRQPEPAEQPPSKHDTSKPDVWECVSEAAYRAGCSTALIDVMAKRRATRIRRYGTPMHPKNGRDAERDLLEVLLVATAYAAQDAIERGLMEAPSRFIRHILAQDEVFTACLSLLRMVFAGAASTGSPPPVDESSPT